MRLASLILFSALASAQPPKLMLWAWEQPADLRFLKMQDAGVAFFSAHLTLKTDGTVKSQLRAQPLRLPPGIYRMAVVRIDSESGALLSPRQRQAAAQMVDEAYRITKADALQIDFDAPKSAYGSYRALLADVRHRVGPRVFLSMTALVSWCGRNSWLTNLAVDEIVPMAFPSGSSHDFSAPQCAAAIGYQPGVSTPLHAGKRRVYAFVQRGKSWDAKTIDRLQNELR